MGTTLANLHILDGDEQQLTALLPKATVGCWSSRFVSLYAQEFVHDSFGEKAARAVSRKLTQSVLRAWIFDSDSVGFAVYQNGKKVVEHIMNPDGYSKMGNIPMFCKLLELPVEDEPRLRTVWKKGLAEEQLWLTASLLGVPLHHDCKMLPKQQHSRNAEAVDKWIAERPAPPKIKSATKAVLIQELTNYRSHYIVNSTPTHTCYCSAEPYDLPYGYDKLQFWVPNADGILHADRYVSIDDHIDLCASQDRILGEDYNMIVFDSAGLLPSGYEMKGTYYYFLPDGGLLWAIAPHSLTDLSTTFLRCASDGSILWHKHETYPAETRVIVCENGEIALTFLSDRAHCLERIDGLTGETIEKVLCPFGLNAWSKTYHSGFWWVAHDNQCTILDEKKEGELGNALTKLDDAFRPLSQLPLPTFTQELFFSPDCAYIYVFFFQSQVMVVNAKTLAIENVLNDKSLLHPLGFDSVGCFWLKRDNSTVEAWDASLRKPLSRHKLKGVISGCHLDEQGSMCVVTWNEKEKLLRVHKLEQIK